MMRHYEIMYILAPLDEAVIQTERENLEGIITSNGGKIVNEDVWGIKEFAYEIKKHKQGYYVVIEVQAEPKAISEFNRLAKINKNELRHMVINLDEQKANEAKKLTK